MSPLDNGLLDDDISQIGQYDGCDISVSSESDDQISSTKPIPIFVSNRRKSKPKKQPKSRNIKTIKRSNKCLEALELPTVINLNPRSVYNKVDEFHTLVSELAVDLVFMSESWERESLTLDQIIDLENYQVISNVYQRTGMGGRPALIINESKYHVQNLTNSLISIPYGVEITWAMLTPKQVFPTSVVKKIAVASIYCKPGSRKKTLLLDHIAETYHMLSAKYLDGLHFILAGDTNDLKLDSILSLSPNLQQVVTSATRNLKMIDPIITTLSKYYQTPVCLPPLDNDPDKDGSPADHMIVHMRPIDAINNNPARKLKIVKHRPLPESGIKAMGNWIVNHDWENVFGAITAHEKASIFQSTLLEKLNCFLPEKIVKFTSVDQVWITPEIKDISRRKRREFYKHRKSSKWKILNKQFEEKCENAKHSYYNNIVSDLKNSNPGQWYSKLKRMTSYDQIKSEEVNVESICHLSDIEQVELIADNFCKVSNQYEPIDAKQIVLGARNEKSVPTIEAHEVCEYLRKIKTNTSTVKDDIPAKLIKEFAPELSAPLADILNCMVIRGEYPDVWKLEMVTPVAKVYPPLKIEDLRKISGLKNFSKTAEKVFGDIMIKDMSQTRDPSQYGNEKGVSVNHYLIKMIDEILTSVDRNSANEKFAVFCSLIDWKQAFDRQCPTLGVKSFVKNGVRNSLVPLLINYFEDRHMIVKWHGQESTLRKLIGGGPQGALWGILEYLAQSNDNTDFVEKSKKFKFIDDLSILEIVNLMSIGIASYNFKMHVATDIPTNGYIIPSGNLKTQDYLDKICKWTSNNKMELNRTKSKAMIFNFTRDHQFTSRTTMENMNIEVIKQSKLLGVIICDNLSWDSNTAYIVKRANARMRLLHKLVQFSIPQDDLINIYVLYVRSILEQSCQVWHSSLTLENFQDLERVQKTALRIILKEDYISYSNALETTGLSTLFERRSKLCLKFAKSSLKHEEMKNMFPVNPVSYDLETRFREKFQVAKSRTERHKNSAIPYMQRLLNSKH